MSQDLKASAPAKTSFITETLERFPDIEMAIASLRAEVSSQPVDARLNLQVFLNAMGKEEEAFAVAQELFHLAPRDPRVLFNYGWHLLKRRELQQGMALLEYGRPLNTYGHPMLQSSRPLWTPEQGRGQTVLLVLEGGFGDEIIHARFAENLVRDHDCKVVVIAQPSLAPLFNRMPSVSAVVQREAALGVYHDSWLPGMSSALALGLEYEGLSGKAYLRADPRFVEKWSARLGPRRGKRRIGLRWAGNPQFEHQQLRLFPPSLLLDLAKDHPELEFYSFQKENNSVPMPPGVTDLQHELKTWEDTAAALSCMDLVISSCTSIAHLSGALGRPTWVIVPALPYFIWALPGESSPWYDSVRLFRQSRYGDWSDVQKRFQVLFLRLRESGYGSFDF